IRWINAEYGNNAATSYCTHTGFQHLYRAFFKIDHCLRAIEQVAIGFKTNGINTYIDTSSVGRSTNGFNGIFLILPKDGFSTCCYLRHIQPVRNSIYNEHLPRFFQPCTFCSHDANRTGAEDRHGLSGLHLTPFHPGEAGWKYIGKEQHLFIAEVFGYLAWTYIAIRNTNVLRLASVISAIQIRITKQSTSFFL